MAFPLIGLAGGLLARLGIGAGARAAAGAAAAAAPAAAAGAASPLAAFATGRAAAAAASTSTALVPYVKQPRLGLDIAKAAAATLAVAPGVAKGIGKMLFINGAGRVSLTKSAMTLGGLHAVSGGLTTDLIVKPVGGLAVGVGGAVVGGTVDMGKSVIGLDKDDKSGGLVGGALQDAATGRMGNFMASGMEAMSNNGLYAAVPLLAGLSLVGGSSLPRVALLAAIIGVGVKLLENAGFTLPGIALDGGTKEAFNRAAVAITPEEMKPRLDNAPRNEAEIAHNLGLKAPVL